LRERSKAGRVGLRGSHDATLRTGVTHLDRTIAAGGMVVCPMVWRYAAGKASDLPRNSVDTDLRRAAFVVNGRAVPAAEWRRRWMSDRL
jgi:hypothetical protein